MCTPIGSTFSIEQTITTLSAWSRISSSSNSPQPITDSSTSTCPIGLAARPSATICRYSVSVAGDAAALAAHGEPGSQDRREPHLGERAVGLAHRLHGGAPGDPQPGALHGGPEQVAVLGPPDHVVVRADQLHAVARERAVVGELPGEVQRGAAAERGQQGVGPLALDHLRHRGREQRLDVGGRGVLRVGHDRGRVGVHEHHLVALLQQHLAGLGARVVELRRLADHDRARADHHDLLDVVAARHQAGVASRSRKRSKRCRASCGPGPASGWYCTVEPGTSRRTRPSTVRS